jgi:hypothetical protein
MKLLYNGKPVATDLDLLYTLAAGGALLGELN